MLQLHEIAGVDLTDCARQLIAGDRNTVGDNLPMPAVEPADRACHRPTARWAAFFGTVAASGRAREAGTRRQLEVARDADSESLLVDEHVDATEWRPKTLESSSCQVRERGISSDGFAGPLDAPQVVDVVRPEPQPPWWLLLLVPLQMAL